MKEFIKQALIVSGFVLVVVAPSSAQSTVTFTLSPSGAGNYQGVEITAEGSSMDAAAGTYAATLGGSAVNVFCVDPNDDIGWGTSYQADSSQYINAASGGLTTINGDKYYNGGLASSLTTNDMYKEGSPATINVAEQADEVGYLAYEGLSNTSLTSTQAAAYQVALWSVIDDGPSGSGTIFTYSDSGLTSLVNGDIAAALANYNSAPTEQFTDVSWIQAPVTVSGSNGNVYTHTQDFVYLNGGSSPFGGVPSPTPEPSIVAFLCSLAGASGLMVFMKRRASATKQ